MSSYIKTIVKAHSREIARRKEIKLRKHLNADALFTTMKTGFDKIEDHRPGNVQHSLGDALMSGFAMFSLKDPSLLAFDERRNEAPHNLMTIYGMGSIPCDTSMREILDGVNPNDLRPLFKDTFRALQRGKALEPMVFMQGGVPAQLGWHRLFFIKQTLFGRMHEEGQPVRQGHLVPAGRWCGHCSS